VIPARLGWCLIAAALLFWVAWFLMPEPDAADASYILAATVPAPTRFLGGIGTCVNRRR
jgi:hypothetical protein